MKLEMRIPLAAGGRHNDGTSRCILIIPTDKLDDVKKFGNSQVLVSLSISGIKEKLSFAVKISKSGKQVTGKITRMIIIPLRKTTKEVLKAVSTNVHVTITAL